MNRASLRIGIPATLVTLFLTHPPAVAKRLDGVFTAVKDANVVVLDYGEGSYDVRIYGTEAPADGQPFAVEAKAFVREALLGKNGAMRFKYRNRDGEMVSRIFYFDAAGRRARPRDRSRGSGSRLAPARRPLPADRRRAGRPADRRPGRSAERPARHLEHREPGRSVDLPRRDAARGGPDERHHGRGRRRHRRRQHQPGPRQRQRVRDRQESDATRCSSSPTATASRRPGDRATAARPGRSAARSAATAAIPTSPGTTSATSTPPSSTAAPTPSSPSSASTAGRVRPTSRSFGGSVDQPSIVAHRRDVSGSSGTHGSDMVARGAAVTGLGVANVGTFVPCRRRRPPAPAASATLPPRPWLRHAVVQVCGPQSARADGNIRINIDADGLGAGVFGASIVAATTNVGGFDFIPAQSQPLDRLRDRPRLRPQSVEPALRPALSRLHRRGSSTRATTPTSCCATPTTPAPPGAQPIQVNTDATTRSQFLPRIASDPATGNVAICWHDARNSATNTAMEVWCDSFTPAGFPTFRGNVQVSDGASISTDSVMDFGDYSGLTLDRRHRARDLGRLVEQHRRQPERHRRLRHLHRYLFSRPFPGRIREQQHRCVVVDRSLIRMSRNVTYSRSILRAGFCLQPFTLLEGALPMSMRPSKYAVPAILILLCLAAQPAAAKRLGGVFTAVKDANVVVLDYGEGSYDVRLYGTEAPADGQPFAREAQAFVRERLLGKSGALRFKWRNAQEEMVSRIFYRDLRDVSATSPWTWWPKASPGSGPARRTACRRGPVGRPVRGQPRRPERPPRHLESDRSGGALDLSRRDAAGRGRTRRRRLGRRLEPRHQRQQALRCGQRVRDRQEPGNPQQLVAHCNGRAIVRRSIDGGLTWNDGASVGSYCCDPNLAWDSYGNLYATVINGSLNSIVTVLSVDGGASFVPLAAFGGAGVDQPSVVATDLTAGGVALWIVWNDGVNMVGRGALVSGPRARQHRTFRPAAGDSDDRQLQLR